MFGFIIRFTKTRLFLLLSALLIAALIVAALSLNGSTGTSGADAATLRQRVRFLKQYRWECDKNSEECKKTLIPAQFDEVYQSYNRLQIEQGFDLSPLKGKTVKIYSIKITNYPNDSEYVYASLLVRKGKIVGGDIHSTALGGFMHGFAPTE